MPFRFLSLDHFFCKFYSMASHVANKSIFTLSVNCSPLPDKVVGIHKNILNNVIFSFLKYIINVDEVLLERPNQFCFATPSTIKKISQMRAHINDFVSGQIGSSKKYIMIKI